MQLGGRNRERIAVEDDQIGLLAQLLFADGKILEKIRANGYATHARTLFTDHQDKTSSLAAQILHDGQVAGCPTLIFFPAALTMREAQERFAGALISTAQDIGTSIT